MKRAPYMSAVLTLSLATTPALAGTMKCDDASMTMVQRQLEAIKDPAMKNKKAMALKELSMARESRMAGNGDECMMHLMNAMDSTRN